jgi:hypothetical protein
VQHTLDHAAFCCCCCRHPVSCTQLTCGSWQYWLLVLSPLLVMVLVWAVARHHVLWKAAWRVRLDMTDASELKWDARTTTTYPAICECGVVCCGVPVGSISQTRDPSQSMCRHPLHDGFLTYSLCWGVAAAAATGISAGVIAGMLGLGGGLVLQPLLIVMNLNPAVAAASTQVGRRAAVEQCVASPAGHQQ